MNTLQYFDWGLQNKKKVSFIQINLVRDSGDLPSTLWNYNYLRINDEEIVLDSNTNRDYMNSYNNGNNSNYREIKIFFKDKYVLPNTINSVEFDCNSPFGVTITNSWKHPYKITSITKNSFANQMEIKGQGNSFNIGYRNSKPNAPIPTSLFDKITNDGVYWDLKIFQESGGSSTPSEEKATSLYIASPPNGSSVGDSFIVRCFGRPQSIGTYSVTFDNNVLRSNINPIRVNLGEIHDFKWINNAVNSTSMTFTLDSNGFTETINITKR